MPSELYLGFGLLCFGVLHFWAIRRRRNAFLLSDIAAWMTAGAVGSAPFVAYAAGSTDLASMGVIGPSYLVFFLYCLGLVAAAQPFRRGGLGTMAREQGSPLYTFIERADSIPLSQYTVAFALLVTARAYTLSKGGGITGLATLDVMQSLSYPMVILNQLVEPVPTVLIVLSVLRFRRRAGLILAVPVFLTVVAGAVSEGRRSVIYLFLLLAFVLAAVAKKKFQARHLVLAAAGAAFAFTIFSPIYLGFRSAIQRQASFGVGTVADMSALVNRAVADAVVEDDTALAERSAQNLRTRTLGLRTVADEILTAQKTFGFLWGRAFVQHQLTGIPRYLRAGDPVPLNPKNFTQRMLGLVEGDATYSPAAAGVADFGLAGAFLAGAFMGLFLNVGTVTAGRLQQRMPIAGLILFATLWDVAINPEINPGFEMQVIRNLALVIGLIAAVGLILTQAKPAGDVEPVFAVREAERNRRGPNPKAPGSLA